MRNLIALVGVFALVACGGGGGGGGTQVVPLLSGAAFVGSGPTPAPGDQLLLFMSSDVVLVAGTALDDADLTLSSGGTLGTITVAPVLLNSRTVRIILGPGVAFTAGSTTITYSTENDAVLGFSGALAAPGPMRTITAGDGDNPTITALTLDEVAAELNGTGPAGGTLQVPRTGFGIDITCVDGTSAIDVAATQVELSAPVSTTGGVLAAGQNLTPHLVASSPSGPGSIRLQVPAGVFFPIGVHTLTVLVVDITGMVSLPATFTFSVRNLDDAVRPFETTVNPSQLWYVDLGRDIESYLHDITTPTNPVHVIAGANGRADLEDMWFIVGLFGSSTSVNDTVRTQIRARLLAELNTLYSGANVQFTFTAPGTFPSSASVSYNTFPFSQICIAGSEDESGLSGTLGVAIFDPHNATQDNNCLINFGSGQRLGVFVHTLVNNSMRPPSFTTFRTMFDPLTPGFGGVPIGDAVDGLDPQRLSGAVQDARATTITNAISSIARAAAVVTAHECGHSVGLVRDGAMPTGLYGGDPTHFPGSTNGHIRNQSFTALGAQNVMSPSLSFEAAISPSTAFNSLNIAYLREQVVYN
jgi:hypothetical protein